MVILRKPEPVLTVHLFAPMRAELLNILRSLKDKAWAYPTACQGWTVKDVALHMLGDDIGLLSRRRDDFTHSTPTIENHNQLVAFINLQNDIWIRAARRISPHVLTSLLEVTGDEVMAWASSLDLEAEGAPVDWAGSGNAPQWLEIAREYTEYWTHHQHICDALDIHSLKSPEYFSPLIATFLRALPRSYQQVLAPYETAIQISVTGDLDETWYLLRERQRWNLYEHTTLDPTVTIDIDADTLWRLFTKGIRPAEARRVTGVSGDESLIAPFFETVAIIA